MAQIICTEGMSLGIPVQFSKLLLNVILFPPNSLGPVPTTIILTTINEILDWHPHYKILMRGSIRVP